MGPRTSTTKHPPLLFADLFGLTAVDARGIARSKPNKYGFIAFDAKPPHLVVHGGSYQSHRYDAALRPVGEPRQQAGALLADGSGLLRFTAREGRPTLLRGDARIDVPDAPHPLPLALGPTRGSLEHDFPRDVVLAPDGGLALPFHERSVRLGHLDVASGTLTLHALVRFEASHATKRAFLPGRDAHVLAALDRAAHTLHLAVLRADGSITHHTHRALGLPSREGDALWFQQDDATVTCVGLDGRERAVVTLPEAHHGAGTVFAQAGSGWFIPWHADVLVALSDGRVIDRALPGDPGVRRTLATVQRRLHDAGRAGGLGVWVRSYHATAGKNPTLHLSLSGDGGDEGTLAHCVMGAAIAWHQWSPPPAAVGFDATGGWIIAARTADVDELVDALTALDAHGLALRDTVKHWAHVCAFAKVAPFTDVAAEVFVRVLLDREATPGTQRDAALRARATAWDDAPLLASLAALRETSPSHDRELLVGRLVARHRGARGAAMLDAMIAAQTVGKKVSYTGAELAGLRDGM
jgi:hypothetical protein